MCLAVRSVGNSVRNVFKKKKRRMQEEKMTKTMVMILLLMLEHAKKYVTRVVRRIKAVCAFVQDANTSGLAR